MIHNIDQKVETSSFVALNVGERDLGEATVKVQLGGQSDSSVKVSRGFTDRRVLGIPKALSAVAISVSQSAPMHNARTSSNACCFANVRADARDL